MFQIQLMGEDTNNMMNVTSTQYVKKKRDKSVICYLLVGEMHHYLNLLLI